MLGVGRHGLIAVAVDRPAVEATGERDHRARLIGIPQLEGALDKLCKARPRQAVGARSPLGVAEGEKVARLRDVRLEGEGVARERVACLEAEEVGCLWDKLISEGEPQPGIGL